MPCLYIRNVKKKKTLIDNLQIDLQNDFFQFRINLCNRLLWGHEQTIPKKTIFI